MGIYLSRHTREWPETRATAFRNIARQFGVIDTGYMFKSLLGIVVTAASLLAQTFDVASIKPSAPITAEMVTSGRIHAGMRIDGAKVDIGNFPLMQLICKAYDVKMYQVSGPPWVLTGQKFDIVANIPAGATPEQVPQMLQALLAERFKLTIHKDT